MLSGRAAFSEENASPSRAIASRSANSAACPALIFRTLDYMGASFLANSAGTAPSAASISTAAI